MILVTIRSPKVADLVTDIWLVQVEGLPTDTFWELKKIYAFGKERAESYRQL